MEFIVDMIIGLFFIACLGFFGSSAFYYYSEKKYGWLGFAIAMVGYNFICAMHYINLFFNH